jgi:hypothetical protein
MSNDRVDSRIEDLPEKKRETFDERIDKEKDELADRLAEKHLATIENQMMADREELSDFNVIVSGFRDREKTDYRYIRTEPFIHKNKKNVDILLASPEEGIAVFVEYERTLASGTDEKIGRFGKRKDFIQSGGDSDLDADAYLKDVLNTELDATDFVVSSQHTPQDRLRGAGERKELNFCVWTLGSHGVTCSIHFYLVKKGKKESFEGHTEDELESYIIDELASRVRKQDYLSFTFSSSRFLKLKHMAVVLVTRYHGKGNDTFTFDEWEHLFVEQDIELNNYLDKEKKTVYANFISYGRACDVVTLEEDRGDILENGYRIKSSATSDVGKLEAELEQKMAERRMADDYEKQLRELKRQLLEEIQPTEETTLSDFTDTSGR